MLPWVESQYLIREQQAEILRQAEHRRLMREALLARQAKGNVLIDWIVHKGRALLMLALRRLQGSEKRMKHTERSQAPVSGSISPIQFGAVEQAGRSGRASRCGRSDI